MAKEAMNMRLSIMQALRSWLFIAAGVLCAGFGLRSFLLPNSFIDGGATGIALLLSEKLEFPLGLMLMLVNVPFILLARIVISRPFAIKAAIAIAGLSLAATLVPFPIITHDKLLVAAFGGFFLGAGCGLAVRGGGVLDGTEVLAIHLSRKTGSTIGDIILLINVLVFSIAAYVLSVEAALYSIITYLAASRTIDFVIEGIEEYTGVTIISAHSEDIRVMIINKMGRGVTVYKGQRGFGKTGGRSDLDIIFTVITRLEITKLYSELEKIDPQAFTVMHSIKDTRGGMIKKRAHKH